MTSIPVGRFIWTLPMPRASRATDGGFCYHVLYRGKALREVFHRDSDYDASFRSSPGS